MGERAVVLHIKSIDCARTKSREEKEVAADSFLSAFWLMSAEIGFVIVQNSALRKRAKCNCNIDDLKPSAS